MISTNGNVDISNAITEIYKQYGMEVYIDLSTSNDKDHHVVAYEGMTLSAGYSDQAYINSLTDAICEISDARIYAFTDPVDTPEMVGYFDKILSDNIIVPFSQQRMDKVVPTVILAPRLSRDLSSSITSLTDWLYSFDQKTMQDQKPPVLVITNIVFEEDYHDIIKLCNAKEIHKYINPEVQEQDQKDGKAPTLTANGGGMGAKTGLFLMDNGDVSKLSVKEARRLQTVPDYIKFNCSNKQIYKQLGNGWTIDVIKEFFKHLPKDE